MKYSLEELCNMIEWDSRFWNPTNLFKKRDLDGDQPGIYVACSNRIGGKTFGIGQILLKYNFLTGRMFGLVARVQDDLGNFGQGVLGSVLAEKYPGWKLIEKISGTKKWSELFLVKVNEEGEESDERKIGYVFVLNAASRLKDYSSFFIDCDILFRDEFQSESYLSGEISKFILLRGSIARGGGEGVRFVPVIMCSNSLNPNNPYFAIWRIATRVRPETHFLRGRGVVVEFFINEYSQKAQKKDPFNKAFENADMVNTSTDNTWLNKPWNCVSKVQKEWGKSAYICTLIEGDNEYGVRWFPDARIYHISRSVDRQCPSVYNLAPDGVEYVPGIRTGVIFVRLRQYYGLGQVRFSDIAVKDVMNLIM